MSGIRSVGSGHNVREALRFDFKAQGGRARVPGQRRQAKHRDGIRISGAAQHADLPRDAGLHALELRQVGERSDEEPLRP